MTGVQTCALPIYFGFYRLQRLKERLNAIVSWSDQIAFSNLDSSEKFSLGGSSGIRAYPTGEGAGDEGHLLNTEIHYDVPAPPAWGNFQINGFFDAGHITLNKNRYTNDVSNATGRNDYWLKGVGLGINYSSGSRFSLRTCWAKVIGDNPGRSVAGNNSDGKNDKSRYWLQAILQF